MRWKWYLPATGDPEPLPLGPVRQAAIPTDPALPLQGRTDASTLIAGSALIGDHAAQARMDLDRGRRWRR
jgi:hypothetical protein